MLLSIIMEECGFVEVHFHTDMYNMKYFTFAGVETTSSTSFA